MSAPIFFLNPPACSGADGGTAPHARVGTRRAGNFPGADDPQYLRSVFQSHALAGGETCACSGKLLKTCRWIWCPSPSGSANWNRSSWHIAASWWTSVSWRAASASTAIFIWARSFGPARDFVFLDFEGDANLPVSERRIKRSPLRDVARIAALVSSRGVCGISLAGGSRHHRRENLPKFEPWIRHWNRAVSRAYLQLTSGKLQESGILPVEEDKLRLMMLAYLLNEVVDELGREFAVALR